MNFSSHDISSLHKYEVGSEVMDWKLSMCVLTSQSKKIMNIFLFIYNVFSRSNTPVKDLFHLRICSLGCLILNNFNIQ